MNEGLPPSGESSSSLFGPQNRDVVIMVVAALIATGVAILWIMYSHYRARKKMELPTPSLRGGGKKERYFVLKNRDKSEPQFTRNPTLAEKGGLPPIKERQNLQPPV
jgi:hypothetical protein